MANNAVLDNWHSNSLSEVDPGLMDALNRMAGSGKALPIGATPELMGSNQKFGKIPCRVCFVATQCRGWHVDAACRTFLLVLRNDGHIVEGQRGGPAPIHQTPGSIFVLNSLKQHRCRVTKKRSRRLRWMALAVDFSMFGNLPTVNRDAIEYFLGQQIRRLSEGSKPLTEHQEALVNELSLSLGNSPLAYPLPFFPACQSELADLVASLTMMMSALSSCGPIGAQFSSAARRLGTQIEATLPSNDIALVGG